MCWRKPWFFLVSFLFLNPWALGAAEEEGTYPWVGTPATPLDRYLITCLQTEEASVFLEEGISPHSIIEGMVSGHHVKRHLATQALLMGLENQVISLLTRKAFLPSRIEDWFDSLQSFFDQELKGLGPFSDLALDPPFARGEGVTPLLVACYLGLERLVSHLIEQEETDNHACLTGTQANAVWMTVWGRSKKKDVEGRLAILQQLKEKGVSLEGTLTPSFLTSLEGSFYRQRPRLSAFILSYGDKQQGEIPSSLWSVKDSKNRTVLHWLMTEGTLEGIFSLQQTALGFSIEQEMQLLDNNGRSPWHIAILTHSVESLQRLTAFIQGWSERETQELIQGSGALEAQKRHEALRQRHFWLHPLPSPFSSGEEAAGLFERESLSLVAAGAGEPFSLTRERAWVYPVHIAFAYLSVERFQAFYEGFQGDLALTDSQGNTIFHRAGLLLRHSVPAENQTALTYKFLYALDVLSRTNLLDIDPIVHQGFLIHKTNAQGYSVLGLVQGTATQLEQRLLRIDREYQARTTTQQKNQEIEKIKDRPSLQRFYAAFQRISNNLTLANRVLSTGKVTREETTAEQAVGVLTVLGENIPLPGAAAAGKALAAFGKGYFRYRETQGIQRTAGQFVSTLEAEETIETFARHVTLTFAPVLRVLTEESAGVLGELLAGGVLTYLTDYEDDPTFTPSENFILYLLRGQGQSRWTTYFDRFTGHRLETETKDTYGIRDLLTHLGITEAIGNGRRRQWRNPEPEWEALWFIEGSDRQARALGFVTETSGGSVSLPSSHGPVSQRTWHEGGAQGTQEALQVEEIQTSLRSGGCCHVQ